MLHPRLFQLHRPGVGATTQKRQSLGYGLHHVKATVSGLLLQHGALHLGKAGEQDLWTLFFGLAL